MFFRRKNLKRKEKGSLPNRIKKGGERISLSFFIKKRKASMTVETACVLPVFVLCMAGFLQIGTGLLNAVSAQTELVYKLKQKVTEVSVEWWKEERQSGQEMIQEEKQTSFGAAGPMPQMDWIQCFSAQTWIGRDPGRTIGWNGEIEEKQMVYIALNGEVYHRDPGCSHIHLSIHSVEKTQLGAMRNENGEKYHPCEECGGGTGNVYITDTGNRYHSSLECSGLKRSIVKVPVTQVKDRRPCSRCF